MPVTDVTTDPDTLTVTITAHFDAPVEKVWGLYADPRRLERVWGPPTHPATVVDHDLSPGGLVHYVMTGPEGERYHGGWRVTAVDAPRSFSFEDFFADEHFVPQPDQPVARNEYTFAERDGGTHVTYVSTYASTEALQRVLAMGMEEGARSAIDQIDAELAG